VTIILAATRTVVFLGVCDPCKRPVRARDEQAPGRYARLTCPQCSRYVTGERLFATINADPCHGRCMGATGPSCSCSCGGANHGRLWEYASEETETALTAYRARIAQQEADAEARRKAKENARRKAFQPWADEHADVIEYLGDGSAFDTFGEHRNDFLYDMARLVNRYQSLSDRQTAAVIRCRDAQRRLEARRAEEAANARPVPTGDAVDITGEIIYTDIKENPYGPGARYLMLIKGEGWKVWSTIPANLRGQVHTLSDLRGKRVQLTAAVEAKPNDPTTGNAKRPRKAILIDSPTDVVAVQ
jgi:hypothetical protein